MCCVAKKKKSVKQVKNAQKKLVLAGVVVAIVVLAYYLFAMQNGSEDDMKVPEETAYFNSQEALAMTAPEVAGQSYFGYMKAGYVLNVEVDGKVRRVEIRSLNDDGTVDMVMNRAYNVEVGETIYVDYDNDDLADLSFTLEGVDLYNNRFSMTLTYYSVLPTMITEQAPSQ